MKGTARVVDPGRACFLWKKPLHIFYKSDKYDFFKLIRFFRYQSCTRVFKGSFY